MHSLSSAPEYVIVDENDRPLWQRAVAGFDAPRAIAAFAALEQRFPAFKMFLFENAIAENGTLRKRMLRNPNLRTEEQRDGALVLVELWHRRPLIRHLNYPGLGFSTEVPVAVPRADYDFVAEFRVPANRPRDAVFRMSQNRGYMWMPGQDRRSTSVGDVLVVHGPGGEPTPWMLLSMGFEEFERFD